MIYGGSEMRALIVFESMFGNTELIADAIADGLSSRISVETAEVGGAPVTIDDEVALLVVGGPTHAFGMSRPGTRQTAAEQAQHGVLSARIGLREWLAAIGQGSADVAVATFDTRIDRPHLPGSAARAADKRLRRLGFRILTPAHSFYVADTEGPLIDGERERARRWGDRLGAEFAVTG
jgi:hypothetical protein